MASRLSNIRGIGPKTAALLAEQLKISDELGATEVRTKLMESGVKLKTDTLIDLKYNPIQEIPRAVISAFETELAKVSHHAPQIYGSYCRGAETSGDVDILLMSATIPNFINTVNAKSAKFKLLPPYALGDSKASTLLVFKDSGTTKYAWCDIFTTTPTEKIFAQVYLIGNAKFNIHMRTEAKKKGYMLNQHGLYKNGNLVSVRDEKKLFEIIGVTWRDPEDRTW